MQVQLLCLWFGLLQVNGSVNSIVAVCVGLAQLCSGFCLLCYSPILKIFPYYTQESPHYASQTVDRKKLASNKLLRIVLEHSSREKFRRSLNEFVSKENTYSAAAGCIRRIILQTLYQNRNSFACPLHH